MPANRHAYLVLAHKDDAVFHALLASLDDTFNDIFVHMDIKNTSYDAMTVENGVRRAHITHIPRTDVRWGAWSQINAIVNLLDSATQAGTHAYYHLLSGDSMPLHTQGIIHHFYESHQGKEFVGMAATFDERDRSRIDRYHLFHETLERESMSSWPKKYPIRWMCDKVFGKLQSKLCPRNKDIRFRKGSTWWSITDPFARYACAHRSWINRVFRYSLCADELFIQTLLFNSPFAARLYSSPSDTDDCAQAMRLIDWKRGTPYTYTYTDLPELINSPMMFARKISNDSRLLEMLLALDSVDISCTHLTQ